MDKQNIYVSFFNALLGMGVTLLLNGNLLIGVIACLVIITVLWVERKRIHEIIFRGRKILTITGYVSVFAIMGVVISYLAQPNRDITMIVQNVNQYLGHLKPDQYPVAYTLLSQLSKKEYPEKSFVQDHTVSKVEVKDYRINKIAINEFDPNKASVDISSPFAIYGKESITLNMMKENENWLIVFSPATYDVKKSEPRRASFKSADKKEKKKKREPGKFSRFIKKVF